MWKILEWPGKGPGAGLLVLPRFLVVGLYLRLNVRDLKIVLNFFVDFLFCDLIAWLPYTMSDNTEIRIVAT